MDVVVVFDFDKTIIECDSDNWVVDELGLTQLFTHLLPTMPWNSLMDRMFMELHSQGKTMEDIAECLKKAPLHPKIISAIKSAHASGCDLRIVSDANAFFIETVLKHHGLMNNFSEIHTNPSFVDEEGRLRILPHYDFKSSSHGCNICPPNMCKGLVMERVRASAFAEGKKKFIYLGDGSADFCSALKLGEGDYLMPRKNYPIWEIISSNSKLIKARINEWSDGEEMEKILLHLITTISIEEEYCKMLPDKYQSLLWGLKQANWWQSCLILTVIIGFAFGFFLPTMPWNSLMNRMFKELHPIEDLAECLKKTPVHPRIISAIISDDASASGCDLKIVNDANAFSIERES